MRLIDADELIKDRVENDPVRIAVQCAPTAFDKEKVIEKIKDESRAERLEDVSISGNVYGYNIERVINEEDVIEIVEKGGLN